MREPITLLYPAARWQSRTVLPEWSPTAGSGPQSVQPEAAWFCAGSCFAERSAKALRQHLLPVHFAAGGALYTPEAILQWLRLCQWAGQSEVPKGPQSERNDEIAQSDKEVFCLRPEVSDLLYADKRPGMRERYLHPHAPGWLKAESREQLLHQLWVQCRFDYQFLRSSKILLLTFGSSFSFYAPATDTYWSNGHRLPVAGPSTPLAPLHKTLLSPEQIDRALAEILELLARLNPEANVLCSVSPLRHSPLSAEDNSLSKAQLLSAVHRLRRQGRLHYFPAYEIVMDEMRDYRWYDAKGSQLRTEAFALLLQRLLEAVAAPRLAEFLRQVVALARLLRHQSVQHGSAATRAVLWPPGRETAGTDWTAASAKQQTEEQAEQLLSRLRQQYPQLDLPQAAADYRSLLQCYALEAYPH